MCETVLGATVIALLRFSYHNRAAWFPGRGEVSVRSLCVLPSFGFLMNHNCAKGYKELRKVSGKFISLGPVTGNQLSKLITSWIY